MTALTVVLPSLVILPSLLSSCLSLVVLSFPCHPAEGRIPGLRSSYEGNGEHGVPHAESVSYSYSYSVPHAPCVFREGVRGWPGRRTGFK